MSDKWRSKVGAHFICKNEEPVMDRLLNSMKGAWDVCLMCDTGSTDKTVEIAEKHGCIIEHFDWIDDFGAARNYSLQKLYEHAPDVDWVVWSDCDDVLMSKEDVKNFRQLLDDNLDNPDVECINLPYIYSHDKSCTGNEGIANFKYYRLRAFKKSAGCYWKCRVHEYIESNLNKHLNTDVVTFHHYRDETKGTINTARNLRILKKVWEEASEQDKPRYSFYLGKEYMYSARWDEAIEMFKTYLPISIWLPEKTRALYELGECFYNKKDNKEAAKWCFEAITIDERYAEPYLLLCKMAYERQDWNMAIAWANMIPFLGKPETYFFDYLPSHTYLPWDYMQASYHFLGNNEKAKECLDKCMSYKPHDRRYLNNWSIFHQDEVEKIGIIVPTRSRKEKLINCINHIKENSYIKNYEIFIGVDGNEEYFNELNDLYKDEQNMTICLFGCEYDLNDVKEDGTDDRIDPISVHRVGVPSIVEELIDHAKTRECKYVTYLGDDTEPQAGFLIHAYKECEGKNLIAFNDRATTGECQHWFAPIDLRDKIGGFFFHKGYNHVGCDNEMKEKADKKGLFKHSELSLVNHNHYIKEICTDKNKVAEFDDCYKEAWDKKSVKKDRDLLALRKANNFIADTKIVNINVGAGYKKVAGYLSMDKYCPADIKADILDEGVFNPETVDKFLLEHVLEHFTKEEGEKVVRVLYNALKKGGELELCLPNMENVQDVTDPNYRVKVMYGWQCDPGHFHKYGYIEVSLRQLLEGVGFSIVSFEKNWMYDAPNLKVICKK